LIDKKAMHRQKTEKGNQMNFGRSRNRALVLALFFSSPVFAQDAPPVSSKEKEAVLVQAIDIASAIYADSLKNALYVVATTRNCNKLYPHLTEKIKAQFSSESSGFDQKTRDEIKRLETSKDPYVKGQIDGAVIVTYDKEQLEIGCKAFAGISP
jgi:hypothetical protein